MMKEHTDAPPLLAMKQIIYFCADVPGMTRFYTEILGLSRIPNTTYSDDEWVELDGNGFRLCLHYSGKAGSLPGNKNKIVFWTEDVGAVRAYLVRNKVKMGVHHHWGEMEASDGRDPEGNKFQISGPSRVA